MAFCIECGSKLPDNAKFCLECGTAVAVKVESAKKEDSSSALKFQFSEQETPKYKEEPATPVVIREVATTESVQDTSAEEEYFDDDNSIELFEETEESQKPTTDLMDDETLTEEASTVHTISSAADEMDNRDYGDVIAAQAKKYFDGLSSAQDYAFEQGMDSSDISTDTMAPILNPISDTYFDDVLPEIEDEINKIDKTLIVTPAIIFTLITLAVIWLFFML